MSKEEKAKKLVKKSEKKEKKEEGEKKEEKKEKKELPELSESDIEDAKEVFDLFDFWDGSDGLVDAAKLGDVLRCVGLNPTNKQILDNGGTNKFGEKQYAFEEILPIYKTLLSEAGSETMADFMEAFKSFDREGQGYIAMAQLRHVLTNLGERLKDKEVDLILKYTETEEDLYGNVKYEVFITKVLTGPPRRELY